MFLKKSAIKNCILSAKYLGTLFLDEIPLSEEETPEEDDSESDDQAAVEESRKDPASDSHPELALDTNFGKLLMLKITFL